MQKLFVVLVGIVLLLGSIEHVHELSARQIPCLDVNSAQRGFENLDRKKLVRMISRFEKCAKGEKITEAELNLIFGLDPERSNAPYLISNQIIQDTFAQAAFVGGEPFEKMMKLYKEIIAKYEKNEGYKRAVNSAIAKASQEVLKQFGAEAARTFLQGKNRYMYP